MLIIIKVLVNNKIITLKNINKNYKISKYIFIFLSYFSMMMNEQDYSNSWRDILNQEKGAKRIGGGEKQTPTERRWRDRLPPIFSTTYIIGSRPTLVLFQCSQPPP